VISIPSLLWEQLLDEFARIVQPVERVAYLDGFRLGDSGVVTTITIPDAELHGGYFTVTAEAMSQAGRHFRQYGMARLAQVHTHGGAGCQHSGYDDEHAYAQHLGALSIVLPYHADQRPTPFEAAIHIRQPEGWIALDNEEALAMVRVVPSLFDYRSPIWTESTTVTQGRLMASLFRWIKQTASRLPSRFRRK
jgi:hypothetical protein